MKYRYMHLDFTRRSNTTNSHEIPHANINWYTILTRMQILTINLLNNMYPYTSNQRPPSDIETPSEESS